MNPVQETVVNIMRDILITEGQINIENKLGQLRDFVSVDYDKNRFFLKEFTIGDFLKESAKNVKAVTQLIGKLDALPTEQLIAQLQKNVLRDGNMSKPHPHEKRSVDNYNRPAIQAKVPASVVPQSQGVSKNASAAQLDRAGLGGGLQQIQNQIQRQVSGTA